MVFLEKNLGQMYFNYLSNEDEPSLVKIAQVVHEYQSVTDERTEPHHQTFESTILTTNSLRE